MTPPELHAQSRSQVGDTPSRSEGTPTGGNAGLPSTGFLAMSRRRGRLRLAAVALAAAVLATACGGPREASVDPGVRPSLQVANDVSTDFLPAVTVWDVGEKEWVQLANFLPADKPVLVWFWAPH